MKPHLIGLFAAFALGTSAVMAQTAPAPAGSPAPVPSAAPSAAPAAAPRLIQFSGALDTLYSKTLGAGGLQFTGNPPAGALGDFAFGPQNARSFDYRNDQLELEDLNVSATLNDGPLGGRILVNLGPQANVSYTYPSQFAGFDLSQIYLTYTKGKATLTGGKFGTLAGYESSESVNDSTVSRGILFWYQPATHLGGRLTYALNDKFTLIGGLNNGWNSWQSLNSSLTSEYGLVFTPNANYSLALQGYTGYAQLGNYGGPNRAPTIDFPAGKPGGAPTGTQGQKKLFDFVATAKPIKNLTLVANYDNGSQSVTSPDAPVFPAGWAAPGTGSLAQWSGLAGYAIYQINPRLTGTVRYEGFHDANGFQTGYRQLWHEATLAASWAATPHLTLRGELRRDVSGDPVFNTPANSPIVNNGSTYTVGTSGTNSNSTLGLEALIHF